MDWTGYSPWRAAAMVSIGLGLSVPAVFALKSCVDWTEARHQTCADAGDKELSLGSGKWICVTPDGRVVDVDEEASR